MAVVWYMYVWIEILFWDMMLIPKNKTVSYTKN